MIGAFQQQLERCYKAYLEAIIMYRPFSVIVLRGEKNKPRSTADLQQAVSMFQQHEKSGQKKGWKIEWMDWSSRIAGKQKWVSKVIVETEEDFYIFYKRKRRALG